MPRRTEYQSLTVEIVKTTDAAICIIDKELQGGREFWVPKSCVEDGEDFDESDEGTKGVDLHIALWWLKSEFPRDYH